MSDLLFLVHRLPYPPHQGDKARSYHLLKHLAAGHRIFLGTFIDDPDDERHVETLRSLCVDLYAAPLDPRMATLRSINGLLADEALTVRYYRDAGLMAWVESTCRRNKIDAAVIVSSAMAQYVEEVPRLPILVDFAGVGPIPWTRYADNQRWPMSWLQRREDERLLAYDRHVAARAARSFFANESEANHFRQRAPECAIRIEAMGNGVDADFFKPDPAMNSPFQAGEHAVVFPGALDCWPNIDAATWFAADILPHLLEKWPRLRFYIVGSNPAPSINALASEHVVVTGAVADVRPYLQHAALIVSPLRMTRGGHDPILQAMAMARPVVASRPSVESLNAEPGKEIFAAATAADYIRCIDELLRSPEKSSAVGQAARQAVLERCDWETRMSAVDRYLKPFRPVGVAE